jgi:hypothetical protein
LFAFDEIVALGYRENVNLAQIRTFTDMESHEEKVFKAMRETQEKEAKQKMLEKAEEIRRSKIADKSHKSSSQYSGGFGSSSMSNSSSYSSSSYGGGNAGMSDSIGSHEPSIPSYSSSSSAASASKSNRAMKLGTNKDIMPAFIEQQVKQSLPQSVQQHSSNQAAVTGAGGQIIDR